MHPAPVSNFCADHHHSSVEVNKVKVQRGNIWTHNTGCLVTRLSLLLSDNNGKLGDILPDRLLGFADKGVKQILQRLQSCSPSQSSQPEPPPSLSLLAATSPLNSWLVVSYISVNMNSYSTMPCCL